MESLIPGMLLWICLQLGCEVPPPPAVDLVSRERLSEMVYGDLQNIQMNICGLYDAESRTILLPEDYCPQSLLDQSTLVHELVHHVQVATEMEYPCPAAREPLAYKLQAQWLREMGVEDPYALMEVNEFTIFIRSLCGPE